MKISKKLYPCHFFPQPEQTTAIYPCGLADANHICFPPGYYLDQFPHSQEEQVHIVPTEMLRNESTSAITNVARLQHLWVRRQLAVVCPPSEANHLCFPPGYYLDQFRHSQEEQVRMVHTEILPNELVNVSDNKCRLITTRPILYVN